MKKFSIEIKWSLIYSIVSVSWILFEKMTGLHDSLISKHPIYTNFFAIPSIIVFALALKNKKKVFYNNQISWRQGFLTGLVLSFFIAIFSIIVNLFFVTFISPNYFINAIEYAVSKNYMTQEMAVTYFNIKSYIIQGIFGSLSIGTITGAVVALVIQTKKHTNEI